MRGPPDVYRIDEGGGELERLLAMEDELATTRPLLYLTVYPIAMRARGDDPALLHRLLARLGYVPELHDETAEVEHWLYQHPDGILP